MTALGVDFLFLMDTAAWLLHWIMTCLLDHAGSQHAAAITTARVSFGVICRPDK